MGRHPKKRYTQTSTTPKFSKRAEAARNRNKAVCKACSDRRHKCDRGPESGSKCGFCTERGIECVPKGLRQMVPDGQIVFVFECEFMGQLETDGRVADSAEASASPDVESHMSMLPRTFAQEQDDATSDLDSCFSPTETLYQPEDTEEDGLNKLRAEIADVGEDELNYRAAHMITEADAMESSTQRASQESFDFMGIERQYVPHSGSVLWIERGQDDLSVIWYIFDGIIYIALCDSDFNILEGPF